MADEPDKPQAMSDPVILRLVKETGVTKTEAHELVAFWAGAIGRRSSVKPDCSVEIAKPSTDHPIAGPAYGGPDGPQTRVDHGRCPVPS